MLPRSFGRGKVGCWHGGQWCWGRYQQVQKHEQFFLILYAMNLQEYHIVDSKQSLISQLFPLEDVFTVDSSRTNGILRFGHGNGRKFHFRVPLIRWLAGIFHRRHSPHGNFSYIQFGNFTSHLYYIYKVHGV